MKKKYPTVIATIDIKSAIKQSFEYIVPVELSHIFKRYKNLPAIERTSNKELWYKPGMSRTIYFEDGTTAREYLLTVNPYSNFPYRIDNFTSSLKRLAKRIDGEWEFVETEKGETHIEWSYAFIPKNLLARILINLFVKNKIQHLLNNALLILKEDLENQ